VTTNPALTRREFLGVAAAALVARAASPVVPAAPAAHAPLVVPAPAAGAAYAYVGTYTPNGGGIYLYEIDLASGVLTRRRLIDDIHNPSWLALNPAQTRLYAVSEIDTYSGSRNGAVASYAIDQATLALTRIGTVSSGGTTPTHISVHPGGRYVFVANYGGGNVAVFPVGPDGALGAATDIRPSVGPRHRDRAAADPPGQFAVSDHDGPHCHMIAADPSGQFVLANDAGLDLTLVWRFDAQSGRLLPADIPAVLAPPGSAPRHFAFHPNGRVFYNLFEHDAQIAVYDYAAASGGLRQRQMLSTLPAKFAGSNLASEIILTADGRFLYAANRLHNGIAILAVAGDGSLRLVSEAWTHADSPRALAIDPAGQFLYSCNQKGDSITSFRIAANGALQFTGHYEPVGSPAVMAVFSRRRA
jgi:6-phosphogluconolactonase (cycloisomerase 2 family)